MQLCEFLDCKESNSSIVVHIATPSSTEVQIKLFSMEWKLELLRLTWFI